MRIQSFDTETLLIEPGWSAPPIVCVTEQNAELYESDAPWILEGGEWVRSEANIHHWTTSYDMVRGWLESDCMLVGHNVAYDLAVCCAEWPELVPLTFAKYDRDQVTDTMLRQKLLDIAAGKYRGYWDKERAKWVKVNYSLEDVTRRLTDRQLQKDGWRLSYGYFRDVPLERWLDTAKRVQIDAVPLLEGVRIELARDPKNKALKERVKGLELMIASPPEQAIQYPIDDARSTLDIYLKQEVHVAYLEDQFRQARRAWWLHLMSAWGLRTDAAGVALLEQETRAEYEEVKVFLQDHGLVRTGKKDGSRDTKKAKEMMVLACREAGIEVRRTDSWDEERAGQPGFGEFDCVSLAGDACLAVDDEILTSYAMYSKLGKMLSNDIAAVLKGTIMPIHSRFDLAETGRTTSSKPNIQNWRRAALHDGDDDEEEAA